MIHDMIHTIALKLAYINIAHDTHWHTHDRKEPEGGGRTSDSDSDSDSVPDAYM